MKTENTGAKRVGKVCNYKASSKLEPSVDLDCLQCFGNFKYDRRLWTIGEKYPPMDTEENSQTKRPRTSKFLGWNAETDARI